MDNIQRDFDTSPGKFTDSDMEADVGPFDEEAGETTRSVRPNGRI